MIDDINCVGRVLMPEEAEISIKQAIQIINRVFPGAIFRYIWFDYVTCCLSFVFSHESFSFTVPGEVIPQVGWIREVNNLPTYIPVD